MIIFLNAAFVFEFISYTIDALLSIIYLDDQTYEVVDIANFIINILIIICFEVSILLNLNIWIRYYIKIKETATI